MSPSGFSKRSLHGGTRRRRYRRPQANVPIRQWLKAPWHWLVRSLKWLQHHRPTDRQSLQKWVLSMVGLGVAALLIFLAYIWITLPDISDPRSLLASQSTVITDRNGIELYRLFSEQDRTYIAGELIPDHMKQAVISIEDERFYDRGCLDIRALIRAVFKLGRAGGGSTITRQLARNALDLKKDHVVVRKTKEIVLGCQLEGTLTKDELIELYLNWIPFGRNAYGIEQATQRYFSISADQLTLAQSAVLASLPQRPSYFSPYGRHVRTSVSDVVEADIVAGRIQNSSQIQDEGVRIGLLGDIIGTGSNVVYVGGRTDQVLKNMQDQGFIREADRLNALKELEDIEFTTSREDIRAPHFVLWVRDQVEELFSGAAEEGLLEQGGLRVETTLDWEMQQAAERAVNFHREDIAARHGANNMALVSLDRVTNEIVAYVGNMDYEDTEHGGKIDMAQAPRQPGSSFKPFVYAAAFQRGYTPASVLYDVPTKIGENEPQNFDLLFNGPMTIRYALGASRNVPAAKAFFLGGGENAILALVSNLGATYPHQRREELANQRAEGFDYGWPLALGAGETPLIQMAHAYSTLANGGTYRPVTSIKRITDKNGNLLYEAEEDEKDVLDERIAYQITSILSDEVARPEEYWRTQLTIPGYETAAKTGTSNKCLERDEKDGSCKLLKPDNAWLLGYTPNLVTGVWVGNADSSAMYDTAGGLNSASPVWRDYMMSAHRKMKSPVQKFAVPEGIVRPQISLLSGQLPTECTPVHLRRSDVFLKENAPNQPDPNCKQLTIDKVTKLLASESCPTEAQEEGSFIVATSILPNRWPLWEKGVQEWVAEQNELWYSSPDHSGAVIPLPQAPTEYCDPDLTPGRLEVPELKIVSPTPNGIASYPSFRPRITYNTAAAIEEVVYEIDGKRVRKVTEPPFTAAMRVPRSIKKTGTHVLKVTLTDEYFNQVSKTVKFRFDEDKRAPSISLDFPTEGMSIPVGASITLRADAQDFDGGLKYVQFYLDDTLLTTKPNEPFELDYVFDVEPGMHTIRAEAQDMNRNTSTDEVRVYVGESGDINVQEQFIAEPVIVSPLSVRNLGVDEVVEIRVTTPNITELDEGNLVLVVRPEGTADEELFNLSEGDGTYVRPWKSDRPGTFTIILYSDSRESGVREWQKVGPFEVQ